MVNGGTVNHWLCINFSRNVQDSVARGFCYELAQMCNISGMVCGYDLLFSALIVCMTRLYNYLFTFVIHCSGIQPRASTSPYHWPS